MTQHHATLEPAEGLLSVNEADPTGAKTEDEIKMKYTCQRRAALHCARREDIRRCAIIPLNLPRSLTDKHIPGATVEVLLLPPPPTSVSCPAKQK